MARPVTIKNEDILSAARGEFLTHGIRATTAGIARRAGVSEGMLFKRFESKEGLFQAAMRSDETATEGAAVIRDDLLASAGTGDVQTRLEELGHFLVDKFLTMMPMVMMAWANVDHDHPPPHADGPPPNAVRGTRALTKYLEAEMRLGRVRKQDAEVLALMFTGSLWQYAFFHTTSRGKPHFKVNKKAYIRGVVQSLWFGLEPRKG